jgi:hypothetical protein
VFALRRDSIFQPLPDSPLSSTTTDAKARFEISYDKTEFINLPSIEWAREASADKMRDRPAVFTHTTKKSVPIEVVVTDSKTDMPLAGVVVRPFFGYASTATFDSRSRVLEAVVTGVDGKCTLKGVPVAEKVEPEQSPWWSTDYTRGVLPFLEQRMYPTIDGVSNTIMIGEQLSKEGKLRADVGEPWYKPDSWNAPSKNSGFWATNLTWQPQ